MGEDAESQDTSRANVWHFGGWRKPVSPRDSARRQAMEYLDLAIAEIEDEYRRDVVENAVRNAREMLRRAEEMNTALYG